MTKSENTNMKELLKEIGLEDHIESFILGAEGRLSIEEAARRCNLARGDADHEKG